MGNRGAAEARAIDASVALSEKKREHAPPVDEASILQGREASDVRWYFETSASAVGIHASDPGSGGMGGSPVESAEAKHLARRTDRHRAAIDRERRIGRRLRQLPAAVRYCLELAYTPRDFGPQVKKRIPSHAALALALPRARTAFRAYLERFRASPEKPHPDTPADWLVEECRNEKSDRATKFRDEAEEALGLALEAFRATTVEKSNIAPPARPEPKPRARGPYWTAKRAARILAVALGIMKPPKGQRRQRGGGIPFLPTEPV